MPVRPEAAKAKEEEGPDSGAGDETAVANHGQKKRECKVQWIDDRGKDLTQILEFEPRYLPVHTLVSFSFFLLQWNCIDDDFGARTWYKKFLMVEWPMYACMDTHILFLFSLTHLHKSIPLQKETCPLWQARRLFVSSSLSLLLLMIEPYFPKVLTLFSDLLSFLSLSLTARKF
jgi:hypothetical protein